MSKLTKDEFHKSLERLQNLAKGTQLHHTPSNSNPGTWPGGAQSEQNEHDDGIGDDGTDYKGVKKSLAEKVRKSQALTQAEVAIAEGRNPLPIIGEKVSKGQALTPAEQWALKSNYQGGDMAKATGKAKPGSGKDTPGEQDSATSVEHTNAGSTEDEIEPDAKKSFNNAVNGSLSMQQGLELSPFLYEFTRAHGEALGSYERRVIKSVSEVVSKLNDRIDQLEKSISHHFENQGEFNKSMAEAVVGIGEMAGASADVSLEKAQQPDRGPKSNFAPQSANGQSQGGVQVVEKSHNGPGGLDMDLSKSQIVNAMTDMVSKSQLSHLEVLKFEHTGQLAPEVRTKVVSYLNGNN